MEEQLLPLDSGLPQKQMKIVLKEENKVEITQEFCLKRSSSCLDQIFNITNAFARKIGFFTSGFVGDIHLWYQLMGNLSSTATNNLSSKETQYIVFSNRLIEQSSQREMDEFQRIASILLNQWDVYRKVWILTEKDLKSYLTNRFTMFPDEPSVQLLNLLGNV